MLRSWVTLGLALAASCKGHTHGSSSATGSASGSSGAVGTPPTAQAPSAKAPSDWQIDVKPIELHCGEKPFAWTAATPSGAPKQAPLAHESALAACAKQPSVDALCGCLTKSFHAWGDTLWLSTPVACEAQRTSAPGAQVLSVSSEPKDESVTAAGETLIFAAKTDEGWSALGVLETAPDVDLATTPKASHRVGLDSLETHSAGSDSVYVVTTHHEAQEKSMGDSDRDGEAHATLCVVHLPKDAWCSKPLLLSAWTYTYTAARGDAPETCAVTSATQYTAVVSPGAIVMKLEHGSDKDSIAGRYTY